MFHFNTTYLLAPSSVFAVYIKYMGAQVPPGPKFGGRQWIYPYLSATRQFVSYLALVTRYLRLQFN